MITLLFIKKLLVLVDKRRLNMFLSVD